MENGRNEKRPRRVGPLSVIRGRDSRAPAASGLNEDVLYAEHHPPAKPVDSSPFRWFTTALHTPNEGSQLPAVGDWRRHGQRIGMECQVAPLSVVRQSAVPDFVQTIAAPTFDVVKPSHGTPRT